MPGFRTKPTFSASAVRWVAKCRNL